VRDRSDDSDSGGRKIHHFAPHVLAIIGVIIAIYFAMRPTPPPQGPAEKPPPQIESLDNDASAKPPAPAATGESG
jgi:hypothetical protein